MSYQHFGNVYQTIRICSNGFLSFNQAGPSNFVNDPIPTAAQPNDIVCPFWDDFYTILQGDVYYQTKAGPTRFIVQWNNVQRFPGVGTGNTFQAILYDTGDLDFRYGVLEGSLPLSGTVGIENADGTVGVSIDPIAIGTGNTCRHIEKTAGQNPCLQCIGDINGDHVVGVTDLLAVINNWGPCPPPCPPYCPADVNHDCVVGVGDLLAVISHWGPCP